MFNDLEKELIKKINNSNVIDFISLMNALVKDFTVNLNVLQDQPQVTFHLKHENQLNKKISDLLSVLCRIDDFKNEKHIHVIDDFLDTKDVIEIGSLEQGCSSTEVVHNDPFLFNQIRKYSNKQLVSTTSLKKIQDNDFHYENSYQITRQLRLQSIAILATVAMGIVSVMISITNIYLQKSAHQEVDIYLKENKTTENLQSQIEKLNSQNKSFYNDLLSETHDQNNTNLQKQISANNKNINDLMTNNQQSVDRIVKAIQDSKK